MKKTELSKDFDPWRALDALKGTSEALAWFLTEGPAAEEPIPDDARASLNGLAWNMRDLARDLHAWFKAASEAGLELPTPDGYENDAVKEPPATYTMN